MHHKRESTHNTHIITEQPYSPQKEKLLENRNAYYVFFSYGITTDLLPSCVKGESRKLLSSLLGKYPG